MLKVILTVCAIISSIMAITLYTTTLPAVQNQADENAAAIEQNAEAIETLENKEIYEHHITITASNAIIFLQFTSEIENYSANAFLEYLIDNDFTDENTVINVYGRVFLTSSGTGSFVFGAYCSNDDLYVIGVGSTEFIITSYLIENITLSDISISLN